MCITRIRVNSENAMVGEYLSATSLKGIPWRNGNKLYITKIRENVFLFMYMVSKRVEKIAG